jgi:signal peptidase I
VDGTSLLHGQAAVAVEVPDGHYWVLGDNWGASDDSRSYGFVRDYQITGGLWRRLYPLAHLGAVPHDVALVEAGDDGP